MKRNSKSCPLYEKNLAKLLLTRLLARNFKLLMKRKGALALSTRFRSKYADDHFPRFYTQYFTYNSM